MRTITNRVILSLLTVCLICTCLVACGTEPATSSIASSTDTSTAQSSQAVEPQSLKLYLDTSNMPETWDDINQKFADAYPDIDMEIEPIPEQSMYDTVLKTKVATDEVPDVFMMWPGENTERYSGQGVLMDLTDKPYMTKVADQPKQEASFNGKVYSLPVAGLFLGMYFNKEIFSKYSLEVPTTWTAFLDVCQKLVDNGEVPIVLPFKESWAAANFIRPAMSSILYPKKPDFDADIRTGDDKYTNAEMTEIMEKFMTLKEKGYLIKDALGISLPQAQTIFANGQGAMYMLGSWELPTLLGLNPDLKLGMFPMPVTENEDELYATSMMEYGISIYTDTESPEAADAYLEFLTKPEIYTIFINANAGMSTMKDVKATGNDVFEIIQEYVNKGKSHRFPQFVAGTWDPAFLKMTQEIYSGKAIAQALQEYQDIVDKKLEELAG